MNFPDVLTATTSELVAFCEWNDRHGNWPQHISGIPAGRLAMDDISARPSPDHVWYDWEGDKWYTDIEIREQLTTIIEQWRSES